MNILILGYGQVGRVLTSLLAKEPAVKSITCGDLNLKEGKEDKKEGKVTLKKVDLTNKEALSKAIGEIRPDIVVNAALPKFNTQIMDCCILNKVNYLDTASFWALENNPNSPSPYRVEQLEYDERFKQSGIKGMINSGVSPGLTNMLAKLCSKNFDEVDHIKIRLLEETKVNKAVFSWCKEWLIDELNSPPLVYAGNKFKLVESHNDEEYDFSAPFGKRMVAHIAQEEVGTIPLYLQVKNVDIKAYDDQAELLKQVINSKDQPEEKADIKTFEEARFGLVVEAVGRLNGKMKTVRKSVAFPKQKDINAMGLDANFITYPTALMMKAFIMASSKIDKCGVFPPEALDGDILNSVLRDVNNQGINILRTEMTFPGN